MRQWIELSAFDNVDLEDSFVISWKFTGDSLVIDLGASIWPGHNYYETPKDDEFSCFKKGRLVFRYISELKGLLSMEEVEPSSPLVNDIPNYNTIETFEIAKKHKMHIVGSFGDVTFSAEEWTFNVAKKLLKDDYKL